MADDFKNKPVYYHTDFALQEIFQSLDGSPLSVGDLVDHYDMATGKMKHYTVKAVKSQVASYGMMPGYQGYRILIEEIA